MSRPAALDDLDWKSDAQNMIAAYAESGLRFSADDLRKSLREPPSCADWGAAFRAARTKGLITCVGSIESTTPSRKGGLIRLWAGVSTKERA